MRWRSSLAVAATMLMLAGCGEQPAADPAAPTPTTVPTLADPIELDYAATLVVDDGAGHALVTDWNEEKLKAVDSSGKELWKVDARLNDDIGGGVSGFSAAGSVVINDYSGALRAYSWSDGSEQWSFDIPGESSSCHPAEGFSAQTTGTNPILGEGDLILLTYSGVLEEDGCETTSDSGNAVVLAIDPTSGEEAWPALSMNDEGRTFGGTPLHITPDRSYGFLSWSEGTDSVLTRIDLKTGKHADMDLTNARSIDDTGSEFYDVYPTTDPTKLLYVYGSDDPDNPTSSAVTRAADLTIPAALAESDSPTMSLAGTSGDDSEGDDVGDSDSVTMEDTFEPVCATDLSFTPNGESVCIQPQLFASAVKYQGSNGTPQAWIADAPERSVESLGYFGALEPTPVDGPDGPLLIVPGAESGIMAVNAADGKTAWTAGDYETDLPWGGQGYLPEVDLIAVTDDKKTSFYTATTGEFVNEHPAGEYASLSSGRRVVLVTDENSTTLWSVVDR